MKGDTQFTHTKHLNDLYFLKCAISTHNFFKPEWINSRKTTIHRKSSIFPNICHHKRQYFELLLPEIKCRYSTADLCTQIHANMLSKSYKTKSTVSGRRARGVHGEQVSCAQRSAVEYRHLISGTRNSKCCRLWWQTTNVGKDGTFRAYSCFSLWIHSDLRKLWVEMAYFKKYRSFKCLVRVNCVSPFIIIILIRSKN